MILTINPAALEGTGEYGGVVRVAVSGEVGSNLQAGTFRLRPGEALVPDRHESDEVFYILEGLLNLAEAGATEAHELGRGQMALIPKGVVHLSSNRSDRDVEVFWCFAAP